MTSTPSPSTTNPTADPQPQAVARDRFIALVDQTRSAVKTALSVDAATRAEGAALQLVEACDEANDRSGSRDAEAVPRTRLEQVVGALLNSGDVIRAAVSVSG